MRTVLAMLAAMSGSVCGAAQNGHALMGRGLPPERAKAAMRSVVAMLAALSASVSGAAQNGHALMRRGLPPERAKAAMRSVVAMLAALSVSVSGAAQNGHALMGRGRPPGRAKGTRRTVLAMLAALSVSVSGSAQNGRVLMESGLPPEGAKAAMRTVLAMLAALSASVSGAARNGHALMGRGLPPERAKRAMRTVLAMLAALSVSVSGSAQNGRVLMESGLPPERATVEKYCEGRRVESVETGRDGNFRFADSASAAACTVRARAGGLRSNEVRLARIPDGNIGAIILHPGVNPARATVSLRSLAVPDSAREAYLRGMEEGRRNRLDKARGHFEKAVRIHPQYAEAWLRLGFVFERMSLKHEAASAFLRAAEEDPQSVQANMRAALIAAERQDWEAVFKHTNRVIAVRPRRSLNAYYFNSLASVALNRLDDAERSLEIARQLDPERNFTKLHLLSATVLEHRGDTAGAVASYRRYLEAEPGAPESPQIRERVAQLEKTPAGR